MKTCPDHFDVSQAWSTLFVARAATSPGEVDEWRPRVSVILVSGALSIAGTSSAAPAGLWKAPDSQRYRTTDAGDSQGWREQAPGIPPGQAATGFSKAWQIPLSPAARAARQPLSPEELSSARHEPIHRDPGSARVGAS